MSIRHLSTVLAVFLFPTIIAIAGAQVVEADAATSPFSAIRWSGDVTEVRVDGVWYRLVALNGIKNATIVEFAKTKYDSKWKKRIGEDLPALLHAMGKPPEKFVELDLEKLDDGKSVKLSKVEMTHENRRAIWGASQIEKARGVGAKDGDYPKLSSFSGFRWVDGAPEAEVNGTWYGLRTIGHLTADEMISFADTKHGNNGRRRIAEDIWQILAEMGHPPGEVVDVGVRDLESGKESVIKDVGVNGENRRKLMAAVRSGRSAAGGSADDSANRLRGDGRRNAVRRIERPHATEVDRRFAFLATLADGADPDSKRLSATDVAADLDQLEADLEDGYSYLTLRGVPYRSALDAVRIASHAGMNSDDFAWRIAKFLALFGDGHTRLRSLPLSRGYLPFLPAEADGGVVAVSADRRSFIDEDCLFVKSIDGIAIDRWLEASTRISAQGSPQFARRQSIENLRYVAHLRRELGLAAERAVAVELQSSGGKTRTVTLPLAETRPLYGSWPQRESGLVAKDIGYLRIAEMSDDPEFLAALHTHMRQFMGTRGLIIDVRDNGGGSRDITRELAPYFLDPKSPHHLVNVAAYRMTALDRPGAQEGYLANRFLFPSTASVWSNEATLTALREMDKSFVPEWSLPSEKFSPWHYFVVAPKQGIDRYKGRVVVLVDSGCFSATDMFLACFSRLENVRLIGQPSGGGSGRARSLRLERSGLDLQASTVASFTPDGKLIDGRGIAPHIPTKILATDLIGRTDCALDRALEELR